MTKLKKEIGQIDEATFLWLGHCILRLTHIIGSAKVDEQFDLLGLLREDMEPYVLAKALEAVRVLGMVEGAELALAFLKHPNPRVRANAVEVVALSSHLAKEHLPLLLADPNNRVYANVVLALSQLGVDFKKNSFKKQIKKNCAFAHSIFWLSDDIAFDRLGFCNELLSSANPHLRDRSFDMVKQISTTGNKEAQEIVKSVNKQLSLYKESEDFFKNSLDRLFNKILMLEEPKRSIFSKLPLYQDKEVEVKYIKEIAATGLSRKVFPASVTSDLMHIEKDVKLLTSYLEYDYGAKDAGLKEWLVQILPDEIAVLAHRKYFVFECAVYDLFQVDNYQIKFPYLKKSLADLKASVGSVVPAEKFSILPNEEIGVLEIFTLALGLYQKHIWSFSMKTLVYAIKGLSWLALPFFAFFFDKIAFVTILLFFLVFYIPYVLKLFVRWQVEIVLMIRNFVHGIDHDNKLVSSLALKQTDRVYSIAKGKYGRIFGFSLVLMFLTSPISGLGGLFPLHSFGQSFMVWLSTTSFLASIGWIYISYLLVEPIAVLAPKLDAFKTATELFANNRLKIILLFGVGSFLNEVVTQYSVDLMNYMVFLGKDDQGTLTILLAVLSSICLAPIAFSNFTIYCMIKLRE
jgi:hypothetical protein